MTLRDCDPPDPTNLGWYDVRGSHLHPDSVEFSQWVSPADAVAHIENTGIRQSYIDGLVTRLRNGFLRAAAAQTAWRNQEQRLEHFWWPMAIQADWWNQAEGIEKHWESLWMLGDFSTTIYALSEGRFLQVAFTGLRFEPRGLEPNLGTGRYDRIARAAQAKANRINVESDAERQAAPAPSHNPRPVGPLEQIAPELAAFATPIENVPKNVPSDLTTPVSAGEFDAWYAAQTPEIQAWGGVKLRQKCSKDHDGRRVLKKATDHITKGRRTGRKPGSKNVPR